MKFLILTLLATVSLNVSTASAANYIDTAGVQNSGGEIHPREGTRGECLKENCSSSQQRYENQSPGYNLIPQYPGYNLIPLGDYKNSSPDGDIRILVRLYTMDKPPTVTVTSWFSNRVRTYISWAKVSWGGLRHESKSFGDAYTTKLNCDVKPTLVLEFHDGFVDGVSQYVEKTFRIYQQGANWYKPISQESCIRDLIPKFDTYVPVSFDLDPKLDIVRFNRPDKRLTRNEK